MGLFETLMEAFSSFSLLLFKETACILSGTSALPCSPGKGKHSMFLRKNARFDHAAYMSDSLREQYTYFKSSFSLKKTECMTKFGGKSPARHLSPQCSWNLSVMTQLHYLKIYSYPQPMEHLMVCLLGL